MKNNVNTILNKLVAYAQDNLMLDALDVTYTLNKLAALAGVKPQAAEEDYGDADLKALLDELAAAVPGIDLTAVTDSLMPLPHTVNYYFNDAAERSPDKAFGFVFELMACAGSASAVPAGTSDGYTHYTKAAGDRAVAITVGGDSLRYTPVCADNRVATLECRDFMSDDITSREAAFADTYRMAIAKRAGGDGDYYCCSATALKSAKVKSKLSDGVVNISLLDYPVPVLAVSGPKNSAAREAAKLIKAAADAEIPCVIACEPGDWLTFYVVCAGDIAAPELFLEPDPLTACGVAATKDMTALMSVLEKGTALSTDLFEFKNIFSAIGGVKHGAKAASALAAELAKRLKAAIAAAKTADEDKAASLVQAKEA